MRYGLGWRSELGAGIFANLDRIDVVEVMAEELFDADRAQRRALRFLRTQVPLVLHATSIGLASTQPVERRRLERVARVVEWLEPELWSEHLAFVRADGVEIGHLAAPPRNDATLEGLQRNAAEARRVVGSAPLLENVASLIDPPLSAYDEREWLHAVLGATGCDLLLDLHNLHANATNFGFDAADVVVSLPRERIGAIHLAGGRRIERGRVLDDHLHDVPDPVYELLALTAAPFVILERDGNYPAIGELVEQIERARIWSAATAVAAFPSVRVKAATAVAALQSGAAALPFLAKLYTDGGLRERFLAAPFEEARRHGFAEADARALAALDPQDLALAARSFAKKRAAKARCRESSSRTLFPAIAKG